ncbi:MAG: hypothetical protein V4570_01440 [Pseudomonadota bacterium]
MNIIAIICNISLLVLIGYFILKDGLSNKDLWVVFIFLAAPLTSLLALWKGANEAWPLIYFRRKALEEKMRIEALNIDRKS